MNSIIKLLIPLVLFNVLCEGHPGGLGFNLKYNYSKYDNNNLNIFLKSNSPGCTGELERKIINGQKNRLEWCDG